MDTGFSKQSAVRLINSMMFLKSDRQAFSTIDMSILDLYSGMCEFIKVGAFRPHLFDIKTALRPYDRIPAPYGGVYPGGLRGHLQAGGGWRHDYYGN